MWITTYHRFASRAAFLDACEQAGWTQTVGLEPDLPPGVALDVVGPLVEPAIVGPHGIPVPGEVIDARYHVNLAWHAREMDPTFAASQVLPDTPSRGWDVAPLPAPGPLPVPQSIPAWKGKAALREAGLLESVEAAVQGAGGRVRDAWDGAATWDRSSEFLGDLATGLDLSTQQVDDMFRAAGAIQS